MEPNATTNEDLNLYEKAENYAKTSLELLKLKIPTYWHQI